MPLCEIELNQFLHKNPEFINSINRFIFYPFVQEYAHNAAPSCLFPQLQEIEHDFFLNTIAINFCIQRMSPISIKMIDHTFVFVKNSV